MIEMEIDPVEKLDELCALLSDQQIEVHKAPDTDPEYHYLGEGCVCITVLNPYSNSKMFIDLDGEFTLTYGAYHSHFYADTGEYEEVVKAILGLLKNEICSASIYYGTDKKWLGSTSIQKDDINKPFKEIFSFVLKEKEFKSKLKLYGGEVQYIFWNPSDNRTIQIPVKYSE